MTGLMDRQMNKGVNRWEEEKWVQCLRRGSMEGWKNKWMERLISWLMNEWMEEL